MSARSVRPRRHRRRPERQVCRWWLGSARHALARVAAPRHLGGALSIRAHEHSQRLRSKAFVSLAATLPPTWAREL